MLATLLTLWLSASLVACGSRSGPQQGADASDLNSAAELGVHEASGPSDAALAATDGACTCGTGQALLVGPCAPTYQLHSCSPTCDPDQDDPCLGAPARRCDRWAASSSCRSHTALPACVPTAGMAFSPGVLRIEPSTGIAGRSATITVQGGHLYIGALFWRVRVGTGPRVGLESDGGCSASFTFTVPQPGVYPVEVNYGVGDEEDNWSLAGFYTASAGVLAEDMAQPGQLCGGATRCSSAAPYRCSCVASRCSCEK